MPLEYFLRKARDFMRGWNSLIENVGRLTVEAEAFRLSTEIGIPKPIIIARWVYYLSK